MRSRTVLERFQAKYRVDPTGCWLWTAKVGGKGYGYMWDGERLDGAHRLSWRLHRGPIPVGLFVLHRCDVPSCVNPEHLFLGTAKDNVADAVAKNRLVYGNLNGNASKTSCIYGHRLTADNVKIYGGKRNCLTCLRARWRTYNTARAAVRAMKGGPR